MNKPSAAAEPETGTDMPTFETLAADPEIAPLLDFEPAPRQVERPDGWTPERQRELIAYIAHFGSPGAAANAMGKNPSGAKHLYRAVGGESFQAAWRAAIALAKARQRKARASAHRPPADVPGMPDRAPFPGRRPKARPGPYEQPLAPGEVYNEHGLPEDEASFNRRAEEARESIGAKLLRCRRALLAEISRNPGKRAAFELLTELPIDWDKAARLEPQADEPWRRPRMLEPDMVVTAENGWFGAIVSDYGPDKIGALREAVNQARLERGLEPIESWSEDVRESASEPKHGNGDADSVLHSWAAKHSEPIQTDDRPSGPPPMRSFGLNSREAYQALTQPHTGTDERGPPEWDPEPVLKIGPAPRSGPASGKGRGK